MKIALSLVFLSFFSASAFSATVLSPGQSSPDGQFICGASDSQSQSQSNHSCAITKGFWAGFHLIIDGADVHFSASCDGVRSWLTMNELQNNYTCVLDDSACD
jgi:hypothetical protein